MSVTYAAGPFGMSVVDQQLRIATELVREVQCLHPPGRAGCRICQLKAEWNRLDPSLGEIA
jgi:hypothetical protein